MEKCPLFLCCLAPTAESLRQVHFKGPLEPKNFPNLRARTTDWTKKHVCFVAGGTGIAPMIPSIMAFLGQDNNNNIEEEGVTTENLATTSFNATNNKPARLTLIMCTQSQEDVLFSPTTTRADEDSFRLIHVFSRGSGGGGGHLTADILKEASTSKEGDLRMMFFICGPVKFNSFVKEMLIRDVTWPGKSLANDIICLE
eukprot:PhM_4_TR11859/c0_g1_i1/m.65913/K00326/E1.6.2.2; cytochrome-b5 reductase